VTRLSELIQSADWKKEKHVPVIQCADQVRAGEAFEVKAAVGKKIEHPNTTEHHIRWVSLYFLPEGEALAVEVGHFEFSAHGESPRGANQGPVHAYPIVTTTLNTTRGGTLYASAYCNIHGLWESSKELAVS